jgi:hypothetical protein
VPEKEFDETDHKAGAVRRAIELAIAETADRMAADRAAGSAGGAASADSADATATPAATATAR